MPTLWVRTSRTSASQAGLLGQVGRATFVPQRTEFGGSGRTDWYQENASDLPICSSAQVSELVLIDFPS